MLRLVLKRFKELVQKARSANAKEAVVPGALPGVVAAFSGSLTLGDYLTLDDHAISEFLKRCALCERRGTAIIGHRIGGSSCSRRLRPAMPRLPTSASSLPPPAKRSVVAGLDQEYSFVEDSPGDTPYKPYDPDDAKPATQIYAQTTSGEIVELSKQSSAVQVLRSKYSLLRYYFPKSIRTTIEKIAKTTIIKEPRK